jgi:hypothetical protein
MMCIFYSTVAEVAVLIPLLSKGLLRRGGKGREQKINVKKFIPNPIRNYSYLCKIKRGALFAKSNTKTG